MNDLLPMTFAFLLPFVPAYLLYRLLPSDTKVAGPFKGLNLQLSGAFAGYFLLTLMAFGFLTSRPKPVATDELWEVRGRIDCQSGVHPIDAKQLQVRVIPASYEVIGDGTFIVRVPATRDTSGKSKFPTLVIEDPEHETLSIDLNKDNFIFGQGRWQLSKDQEMRAISVSDVIPLKRKTSYLTTGAAPQPVAPVALGSEVTQ